MAPVAEVDWEFVSLFSEQNCRFSLIVAQYALPEKKEVLDVINKTLDKDLLNWLVRVGGLTRLDLLSAGILLRAIIGDRVEIVRELRLKYGHVKSSLYVARRQSYNVPPPGRSVFHTCECTGMRDVAISPIKLSLLSSELRKELAEGYGMNLSDPKEFCGQGCVNNKCGECLACRTRKIMATLKVFVAVINKYAACAMYPIYKSRIAEIKDCKTLTSNPHIQRRINRINYRPSSPEEFMRIVEWKSSNLVKATKRILEHAPNSPEALLRYASTWSSELFGALPDLQKLLATAEAVCKWPLQLKKFDERIDAVKRGAAV